MFWILYEILFLAGVLVAGPYYLFRMRRRGGYGRGFGQRFGVYDPGVSARLRALDRPVWIHAVSVGEIQMAFALIDRLRERDPKTGILLTTTTSTGFALAREREGPGLAVVYYPMDSRLFFGRIHRLAGPRAFVLMEAELWPNHILYCRRRGLKLALVNARMSERSHRNYLRGGFLFRRIFSAFDVITLQSERDRERVLELGARPGALRVIGSLKYGTVRSRDQQSRDRLVEALSFLQSRPVLVGASTHPGEEAVLVEIWKRLRQDHPRLGLVLAPRHVERRAELESFLGQSGVSFRRRSADAGPADVVLLDTTGELRFVYELATVVFIGKSLRARGGQNLMEPAWYGKAIVFGPNMQNFPAIVEDFLKAEAAIQVRDEQALLKVVGRLLNGEGEAFGRRAKALMDSKQDVMDRTVQALEEVIGD